MALTTMTDDLNIIAALDDEPNDVGGLTASQLRAKFDEGSNDIKTYINDTHIPELDAEHLPYIYGSANTIKDMMENLTVGVMPDDSVTTAKLEDESVTAAKIEDGAVTSEKLASGIAASISESNTLSKKNLLNILRLKLQMSLAASDIDAWSDLLAAGTQINSGASSGYTVSGGKLTTHVTGIGGVGDDSFIVLGDGGNTSVGQTFLTTADARIHSIVVKMYKVGSPTDNLYMKIYASDKTTLLYTSEPISGSTLSNSVESITFYFEQAAVSNATTYFFAVERSGSPDESNCYSVRYIDEDIYPNGSAFYYNSGSWASLGGRDLGFTVYQRTNASVVWNAVTPTEALTYAALTADQDEGYGSIVWYLSDDGTNWTEFTALDAMQEVGFDAESVYLKCVLTSNAEVDAVAWGGY